MTTTDNWTPADHFRKANRLVARAETAGGDMSPDAFALASAQVHAIQAQTGVLTMLLAELTHQRESGHSPEALDLYRATGAVRT